MADLEGAEGLHRRLGALTMDAGSTKFMRNLGIRTIAEMKRNIPRKTSSTSRTISLGRITQDFAEVRGSPVVIYLDEGTRQHDIHPVRKKMLRFPAKGAKVTLAGRARAGQPHTFAKVVHHPGTRAQPFIKRSVDKALYKSGIRVEIINLWNKAD